MVRISKLPVLVQNAVTLGETMLTSIPTMAKINARKKNYTAISLFSGCGGSSTGHKAAGMEVLYANEFISAAQDTYALNHPNTYLDRRDVREVKASEILKIIGLKKGQLDLLDASPPCKAFSTAGARDKGWGKVSHYSDGVHQRTDDLFNEFIRLLRGIMPKTFVAENVPGLVHGKAKGLFLEILRDLKESGYQVSARVLNAAYLGVPQARERLIFVGVRNDIAKKGFLPQHPVALPNVITVRQALPHIALLKNKKNGILTYVPADMPSPTIVASDGTNSETAGFSCGGFIETEEGERRKYSIKELKVISTFPSDFRFTGTYKQRFERIGRAVPPMMMYHISRTVAAKILKPYYESLK